MPRTASTMATTNRGVITGPDATSPYSCLALGLDTCYSSFGWDAGVSVVAMPGEPHSRPPRSRWRLGTPLVILACGVLFVTSAANSQGTDLRPGRYTDLASLVEAENQKYEELQARVRDLDRDVARLTDQVETKEVRRIER